MRFVPLQGTIKSGYESEFRSSMVTVRGCEAVGYATDENGSPDVAAIAPAASGPRSGPAAREAMSPGLEASPERTWVLPRTSPESILVLAAAGTAKARTESKRSPRKAGWSWRVERARRWVGVAEELIRT